MRHKFDQVFRMVCRFADPNISFAHAAGKCNDDGAFAKLKADIAPYKLFFYETSGRHVGG